MKIKKIIKKIKEAFQGCYGIDDLYYLGLGSLFLLYLLNIIVNSRIISILELVLIFIMTYRAVSKDINKRYKENQKYRNYKQKILKKFKLGIEIIKNYNNNYYKRCPKCKQMLKLPLKKGKHEVRCPNCGNKFVVKCHRNQKIKVEVVKNRK